MAFDPMKFFRKHNKKMLAVFMALLLVVWLGGSALQSMLEPNPQSREIATTRYGKLHGADHVHALRVTNILDRIGLPWNPPGGLGSGQAEPMTLYEWMLLTREARAMGFEPHPDEAVEFLNGQGWTTDRVSILANRMDIAPEHVYAAVSEFQSVFRAIQTIRAATSVSEAEVRAAARDVLEKVKVQLVALPAESFLDPEATFTEAELEEQLAKYREQEPGAGMTFGYFLPPRIKAQYIKLDVEKVEAGLRESEASLERKAKNYWRENRDKDPAFLLPPTTQPADQAEPKPTTQAADQAEPEPTTREADQAEPETTTQEAGAESATANHQPGDTEASDADEPTSEAADVDARDIATDGSEAAETAEVAPPDNSPGSAEAELDQAEQEPQQPSGPSPDEPASKPAPGEPSPDESAPDQPALEERAPEEPAPGEPAAEGPAPDQAAPEKPAPGEFEFKVPAPPSMPSRYFDSYPEAREAALAVVRRQAAVAEVNRITEYLGQRIADPWYDVEEGEDGYRVLPPPVEDLTVDDLDYYQKVIARMPPELRYEGTLTTTTTDWFTQAEASIVPGLGTAAMGTQQGRPQVFGRFAFLVRGLAEIPNRGRVDRTVYLAWYQSSAQWLMDRSGNRYLYRIIEVEPARAPESLDEVREQVIEDLRLQRAYQEAQGRAEAILVQAKEIGLKPAWDAQTELQETVGEDAGYQSAAPFARKGRWVVRGVAMPTSVQGVGPVDDAFLERCFALGPASGGREQHAVIPLPDAAKIVVVEWDSTEPVRKDAYARQRQTLVQQLGGTRQAQLVSEWLNPELIRSRNEFKFSERD